MEKRDGFTVGDRVFVLRSDIHGWGRRVGIVIPNLNPSPTYPIRVKFGEEVYDYSIFKEDELELDKNHIVTQILNDL